MAGENVELDGLERELLAAADTWFSAALHRRLQRLVEIARIGQRAMAELAELRHRVIELGDLVDNEVVE